MTEDELKTFYAAKPEPEKAMIGAPDRLFTRTLLYGYSSAGQDPRTGSMDTPRTYHVYMTRDGIALIVYTRSGGWGTKHRLGYELVKFIDGPTLPVLELIPTKRLYPEACDFAFCKELVHLGGHLTFTNFGTLGGDSTARLATTRFAGFTIGDFDDGFRADPPELRDAS